MAERRRVRLIVEYDGTNYAGWQRQLNGLAVQQVLEEKAAPWRIAGEVLGTVTGSLGGTGSDTVDLGTVEAYESAFLKGLKNT